VILKVKFYHQLMVGGSFNSLSTIYAFNYDGSVAEGFPKFMADAQFGNIIPIGDVDVDGDNEIIVGTWSGTTYVYDTPGQTNFDDWPLYQHDAAHTGNYISLGQNPGIRPQSKVVNLVDTELNGNLIIELQRFENDIWETVGIPVDEIITIPANGLLKLDIGEDNLGNQVFKGFNNLDVKLGSSGKVRVKLSFENNDGVKKEAVWEFDVA